tara:strand:- start:3871 stop:9828 length:5958 start_codon:yes stop_codon:yes gene_type:complete
MEHLDDEFEAELENERALEEERHLNELGEGLGAEGGVPGAPAEYTQHEARSNARNYQESVSDDASLDERGGEFIHTTTDMDDDESLRGDLNDGASSYATRHVHQGMEDIPGWCPMIQGKTIDPIPPVFATGLPGSWVQYNNSGPFPAGVKCRPARVIDFGFIAKWQQASDAERISDMTPQVDPLARARAVASCALMGLLSVGTAKGFIASENHSEFTMAKAEDDEALNKLKKSLNGKIGTYSYCPNANDSDESRRSETAMMFCFVHVAMHDPAGKYIGFKILMLIFDKGFSTDYLVSKVMEENALIKASGQINGMPEQMRNKNMERQNKLQRTQITDENLETTAETQYKRVCTVVDWIKFMESVGGKTDGNPGRPYYANIGKDTPPNIVTQPFVKDGEFGGRHPIGPSVSHNHKRYQEATESDEGINVSIAGTLDARGHPLELHESLIDPTLWYDAEGNFEPPQHVLDNGWCHICHDPSITNIFHAPLPQKMHGSIEPDEILLEQFWKLNKDSNSILKKAQQRGFTTFQQNRDNVLSLFHRTDDTMDPDQQRLSNAVLETEMLSNDSIDKSAAEEATIERKAYGKTTCSKQGDMWVLSPLQRLRDLSVEQETVHAMTRECDNILRAEIRNKNYSHSRGASQVETAKSETRNRRAEHAKATTACIKLGLERFEESYNRKKVRKTIPPGYQDVAHTGLKDAIKECGAIAVRLNASGKGRQVNPKDNNALIGTANLGFAHGKWLGATDFTPFGQWRQFLMHLFSAGVGIAGGDVKLMLEMHCHAFEPFQEVSFFLLLCGGPGSGKSMRAKRLMALLPDGWVKGSGSASAKAGMNGGMDFLCGRLVYYDEITNDFASNDSERIEYLKSITMEQRVLNTRTVKTVGEGGLDTFTTVVLDSLHYESHLMCTNCGPLGLKADVEPSTNRAALSDRSWAHMVHSTDDDDDAGAVEFDLQTASDDLKQHVNKYRVCSCLVAYVLIFIKHIPSCRPNLTYANMLCNKWYEILDREYNMQKPSKRKRLKLRMLFELFAVESAVFEKFALQESGMDYEDMLPDADGNLSPFCIEQLVDVVRSLQRCLDWEVIHTAFSHSLDHSPMTSAHRFQMMLVLSQLHGCELDQRTLDGVPAKPPLAPEPPACGTDSHEPWDQTFDHDVLNDMEANHLRQNPRSGNSGSCAGPSAAPTNEVPLGMAPASDTVGAQFTQSVHDPPPSRMLPPPLPAGWKDRDNQPLVPPTDLGGNINNVNANTLGMMANGMSRKKCAEFSEEMATTREMRAEMTNRALSRKMSRDGVDEHQQLTKLFTDGRDARGEPMHRMTSTGEVISAKRAAGACMPNVTDVMSRGVAQDFVKSIVCGMPSSSFDQDSAMIGTRCSGWEYEILPTEAAVRSPADFEFNWAILNRFKKNGEPGSSGGVGGAGQKQKSVWTNSARVIKNATTSTSGGTPAFSLMKKESMSTESMRDTLFQIAYPGNENKIRIPQYNASNRGRLNRDSCMLSDNNTFPAIPAAIPKSIHPHCMFTSDKQLDPAFANSGGIERPMGSTVALSDFQKRLDHLTTQRALPACILPEGFERGVPIKESESRNGIYFNKHTASEHSALVVESALYLANVPGISGGNYEAVPDSFIDQALKATAKNNKRVDVHMEESRKAKGADCTSENGDQPSETDHVDEEEDGDEMYAENEQCPEPDCDDSADLDPARMGVTHPDSEDTGINATRGATAASARASVDPSMMTKALPLVWDQLAIFFSLKMAATLHNDCCEYVDKVRSKYPDVFEDEEREETLSGLPQLSMRFPGIKESALLFPMCATVPLAQSRFCDVAKQVKSSRASKGLTESVHSMAHGRSIAYNDPEVVEQEASARGVDSGFRMEGNIFARSTWQRFTISAMDARGMLTPEEEVRVNDQGLCMRLRVRNHRAAVGHPDARVELDGCILARPQSFAAKEKNKRKCSDIANNDSDDDTGPQSLASKRRACEQEVNDQMMVESLDADVSC